MGERKYKRSLKCYNSNGDSMKEQKELGNSTPEKEINAELTLSLKRTESLFDGIIAIAMTLLVLDIKMPIQDSISNSLEFIKALGDIHLTFIKYFTSFFILASIWIANNKELDYLKKTNRVHIWLNLFCLFFLVLIPFTTSVQDDYSGIVMAAILFHLNIFFVELFILLRWFYIRKHKELTKREILSDEIFKKQIKKSCYSTIIPLLAIASTFFIGEYSNLLYVLFFFAKKKN